MGWENRGDGRYYYKKVWRNGSCRTEYIGAGFLGELAASRDLMARACDGAERDRHQAQAKQAAALDRQLDDYRRQVLDVVAAYLTAHGFHQHRRQWRKRRDMAEKAQLTEVEKASDKLTVLGASTLSAVLTAFKVSAFTEETLLRDLSNVRNRLGWQEASGVERLLLENIGLCYLQMSILAQQYATHTNGANYNSRTAEHFERRLTLAQHRFLRGVETLAKVRRLTVNLQINVGHQQIIAR